MPDRLVAIFPGLALQGYRETSPPTWNYNCIAWAACRTDLWWEPDVNQYYYWPPGVARDYTLQAYADAYMVLGFEVCATGDFELRFEKIALFVDAGGLPTHAARQLDNGSWTSKLGPDVDIEHATPQALSGNEYGQPVLFMRRPRSIWRRLLAILQRVYSIALTRLRR